MSQRELIEQQTAKKDRKARFTQKQDKFLPTLKEAEELLELSITEWELSRKNKEKLSAVDRWNACEKAVVSLDYNEILIHSGGYVERVVNKKGILFNNGTYQSSSLVKYIRQKVNVVLNIDDVSELAVFDMQGNFIDFVKDNSRVAMSVEEINTLMKTFEKDVRVINKLKKDDKLGILTKMNIARDLMNAKKEHRKAVIKNEVKIFENPTPFKTKAKSSDEILLQYEKNRKEAVL